MIIPVGYKVAVVVLGLFAGGAVVDSAVQRSKRRRDRAKAERRMARLEETLQEARSELSKVRAAHGTLNGKAWALAAKVGEVERRLAQARARAEPRCVSGARERAQPAC